MRRIVCLAVALFAICNISLAQMPTPGNYAAVNITTAGGNATVAPTAIPGNATSVTAFSIAGFRGSFFVNLTTGVVTITGVPFMPQISSPNASCYQLILNNGATVVVKTGGNLNITGN